MSSYFIVFHAEINPRYGPVDIGDDPCFNNPPSWGICRPNYRKSIQIGTDLFFIGYVKPNQYFVRGWFQVGEKISYLEAKQGFPDRTNIIISLLSDNQQLNSVIQNRKVEWRYKKKKQFYDYSELSDIPVFLYRIISHNQIFIQNPFDTHEIDNWKCNRIFHCSTKNFLECITANNCLKEGEILNPLYHNYIVAHKEKWIDIGAKHIQWEIVENIFHFNLPIHTPRGHHNVLCLPEDKTQDLINYLKNVQKSG